jgi:hypothetical protein
MRFRSRGKNSFQGAIGILSANRYRSAPMQPNYSTLTELAEAYLEKILGTNSIPSCAGTVEGFSAISKLKDRLQKRYERAYPGLAAIITYVIDQEEMNARNLSPLFPHLVLPGLVEIHMGRVGLELPWEQTPLGSAPFRFIGQVHLRYSHNCCDEPRSTLFPSAQSRSRDIFADRSARSC